MRGKYCNLKFTGRLILLMVFTAAMSTCDMPMGLGDPVDISAPTITILSPTQNQSLGTMVITDPVALSGKWDDDIGVTELRIIITNARNSVVHSDDVQFTFTINSDKTWNGTLFLPDPGEGGYAEFKIRIIAVDRFGNQGADEVTIRVDIVAPWVEEAKIIRHPDEKTFYHQEPLQYLEFYENIINFNLPDAYKVLSQNNIDNFQNESFTLKLRLDSNWTDVATSRLHILDRNGNRISGDSWGIVPSRQDENPRSPEWDFTSESFNGIFANGPNYIEFEVWAWNQNEWIGEWDTGSPREAGNDTTYRRQRVAGTCWYPETDRPILTIEKDTGTGQLTLVQGEGLVVTAMDDDRLKNVYAALIPKDTYLNVRGTNRTDDQFHEDIRVNKDGIRSSIITSWNLENRIGAEAGIRNSVINIPTNDTGEFRLILFASDDKYVTLNPDADSIWSIYPPLMIDVMNPNAPIIVIESPHVENSFPDLTNGRNFTMSGYTIDQNYTQYVQIAWIPAKYNTADNPKNRADAAAAFVQTMNSPNNQNAAPYVVNDFRIWKIPVGEAVEFILNNNPYHTNAFTKNFDIIDDFMVDGVVENATKLFYIHTRSFSNADEYKTFRLTAFTEQPQLTVNYPVRDNMIHSTQLDLELSMTVAPGKVGLKNGWYGIRIRDITNQPLNQPSNPFNNINQQDTHEFMGSVVSAGNLHTRKLTRDGSVAGNEAYFAEGSRKVFLFEAEDILGNKRQIERKVIMSNAPSVLYINCTNPARTYGIGTELRFEAVFSMPVHVDTSVVPRPRLKLYFNNPGDAPGAAITNSNGRYAEFLQAGGSNVIFRYIVQEGDLTAQLFTAVDSVDVTNGSRIIYTTQDGSTAPAITHMSAANQSSGSLQALKMVGLNGVRPRVTRAAFTQIPPIYGDLSHPGSSYFNVGKTITLELTVDKQVRISGTPQALLSWTGSPNNIHAQFSSLESDNTVIKFSWEVPSGISTASQQVRWGIGTSSAANNPWIVMTGDNSITDNYGNVINLGNLPSDLNGNTVPARAFIITTGPGEAQVRLYNNTNFIAANEMSGNDIHVNTPVYIQNTRPNDSTLFWYSEVGGGSPKRLNPNQGTTTAFTTAVLADVNAANNGNWLTTYRPSSYAVTAWYEDYAGNTGSRPRDGSGNDILRNVTINSRAPELDAINSPQPNNEYSYGSNITINLVFSGAYIARANASVTIDLAGNGSGTTNVITDLTQTITATPAGQTGGTIIPVVFTVPQNKKLENIKVTRIQFNNIVDEYGNTFKNYRSATATEDASWRPLLSNSAYNLDRPLLIIDSIGPQITGWSPGAGALYGTIYQGINSANEYANGGILPAGSREIKIEFDKDIIAQSGRTIIIRPYGNWGVPPVLSNEEFNKLYTSEFYNNSANPFERTPRSSADVTTFQNRLKWLDANGLPRSRYTPAQIITAGAATNPSINQILQDRHENNYYTYTTRGLRSVNGSVRPDLDAKWVLAFRHDIYEGIGPLREVFNSAEWKWLRILSTSASISGRTATITLPEELDDGRIWEVLIEDGAFRDKAGNITTPVQGGTYRFWSGGTASPVIRVDRYSHSDHFHGLFDADSNMFRYFGGANRPKIDTRVRIDCETPGATIFYDTIRTHFTPAAAGTGTNTSVVFTTFNDNHSTGDQFFNHPNINAGTVHASNTTPTQARYALLGGNPGFANGWIGNAGSRMSGTGNTDIQATVPVDGNGYWESLLVPVTSQTATVPNLPISQNGAITQDNLNTAGNAVMSGRNYRTFSSAGAATYHASVFAAYTNNTTGRITTTAAGGTEGRFFYAGDAYATGSGAMDNRDAAGDTDSRLFSGRRDYVVANAKKDIISSGTTAAIRGPALAVSAVWDSEGVFKTTVLHRNPGGRNADNANFPGTNNGTRRIYMQGFDKPVNTTIAGFPLNESTVPFPVADNTHLDYFTRLLWRVGTETEPAGGAGGQAAGRTSNNYIWVSWDIVTDWYQKGRCWGWPTGGTGGGNEGRSLWKIANYGSILCTYGAVNYRFEQMYWTADWNDGNGRGFR